ncbi:uncharacterized protein METZ01_LOCUS356469, partial [marine metagenome]
SFPEEICSIYHDLLSFDISNNSICPPYPSCIEYLGKQNTSSCDSIVYQNIKLNIDNVIDNHKVSSMLADISNLNTEYFQSDVAVLQDIIDKNEILDGRHPLSIGRQKWEQMRLVSLDLSDMSLTDLPISLCSLTPQLRKLDLSGNSLCPPYPYCIEYISSQDITGCGKYSCPDSYVEIDDACYMGSHIGLLQSFIDQNASLDGIDPLDLSSHGAHLKWTDGGLDRLIMRGKDLTTIPEDICTLYSDITLLDISNNHICPPYPSCMDDVGRQDTEDCIVGPCADGYIYFEGDCYYYGDLQVLLDFTRINPGLENYH